MLNIKPFKQSKGYCGPASLKMVLGHYKIHKSENELAKLTKTSRTKGCKEENMVKLMTNLKAIATKQLAGADLTPKIDIELEIDFEDIAWDLVDLLDKFSPYGQENPEPLFMSKGIKISSARKVGLDQKHWKLELSKGNKSKGAIAFGLGEIALALGDSVDIVYNLSINQWNGNREIQLIIRDIRLAN